MNICITADFDQTGEGVAVMEDAPYEIAVRMAAGHPEHRFHIFYAPSARGLERHFPPNAVIHQMPRYHHPLLRKLWYDLKLSRLLKKHSLDILLTMDGYCSAGTTIPQCLLMPGSFGHETFRGKKMHARFYRWLLPGFLSRASLIVAQSQEHEALLRNSMSRKDKSVEVVYGGVNPPGTMLSAEDKTAVLQRYTEGMEYFIYEGPVQTGVILPILKAFSLFKKRQRTSWKLVLNETAATGDKSFDQLLRSYKYRDDVVVIRVLQNDARNRLQGAAYGAIDTGTDHYSIQAALAWMVRGIPYIAAESNPVKEIDPRAALFFKPGEPTDMAERLMELYKDEALHARLSDKGHSLATKYNWQTTADAVWEKFARLHGSL